MKITPATAAGLALVLFGAGTALADSDGEERRESDHDAVYSARQHGAAMPMADILAVVEGLIDGEIIGTDLEVQAGRLVYEFKYVDPQGRVRELYLDARSGKPVSQESE